MKFPTRVFKHTHNDWYPCWKLDRPDARFPLSKGLVQVSVIQFIDKSGYRVSVWGADDDGMEMDFGNSGQDRIKAIHMFKKLIKRDYVNKSYLAQLGFVRA